MTVWFISHAALERDVLDRRALAVVVGAAGGVGAGLDAAERDVDVDVDVARRRRCPARRGAMTLKVACWTLTGAVGEPSPSGGGSSSWTLERGEHARRR